MTSILFRECIESLGNNVVILSEQESKLITEFFEKTIPLCYASIDWRKINKKNIATIDDIFSILEELLQKPIDEAVYIFWNNASLPVIKTNLKSIVANFDDVTSVGFETWIYNPYQGYIIESRITDRICLGLVPTIKK